MQYIPSHAVQVEAGCSSVTRVVVVVADGTNQGTCELPDGSDEIKKSLSAVCAELGSGLWGSDGGVSR